MAKSIIDFAQNIRVKPRHTHKAVGLFALLPPAAAVAVAAEVRRKLPLDSTGALLSEPSTGYSQKSLSPAFAKLVKALDHLRDRDAERDRNRRIKALRRKYGVKDIKEKPFNPQQYADQDARKRDAVREKSGAHNPAATRHRTPQMVRDPQKHKSLPATCDCNGSCDTCQISSCQQLADRLALLDTKIKLARQQKASIEANRKVKSLLAAVEGKSLEVTSDTYPAREVGLSLEMLNLREERDQLLTEMEQFGCTLQLTHRDEAAFDALARMGTQMLRAARDR